VQRLYALLEVDHEPARQHTGSGLSHLQAGFAASHEDRPLRAMYSNNRTQKIIYPPGFSTTARLRALPAINNF